MVDIKAKIKDLPLSPGVYIMKNLDGEIIYVGKAKYLKNRVSQYFINENGKDIKTRTLVSNIYDFDYIITESEYDALLLENNLIKKYMPRFNILLKDDKTFPYIKINMDTNFPYIEVVRRIEKDNAKYFGPYMSSINIRKVLSIVCGIYKIRLCKKTIKEEKEGRPCLNYSMNRCLAPCSKDVSQEEYAENLNKLMDFLKGDTAFIKSYLTEKMSEASKNLNFELAINYREQLECIKQLETTKLASTPSFYTADIFSIESNGIYSTINVTNIRNGKINGSFNYFVDNVAFSLSEALSSFVMQYYTLNGISVKEVLLSVEIEDSEELKSYLLDSFDKNVTFICPKKSVKKKLVEMSKKNAKEYLIKHAEKMEGKKELTLGALKQAKEYLKLDKLPRRIECFDISNISGIEKVASMSVLIDGEKAPKYYRRFIIKTVVGANDFECIYEVVSRRLNEYKLQRDMSFSTEPDLIVIDGGSIQLKFAKKALSESGLSFNMIALAEKNEEIYLDEDLPPLNLPNSTLTIRLLQRVRDEAHRFAITHFRNIHRKNALKSELNNIDGVGEKRKKALIKHFKTMDNIKKASKEELEKVDGISWGIASNIYNYFNNK